MQNKTNKNAVKQENQPVWNTAKLYHAIDWWKNGGTFNKELYERIVEIKYQIQIK